jgi:Electron transfer DM13
MSTRAKIIWAGVAVAVLGGAAGLYWFQPWKLFTSRTVNESLPVVVNEPAAPSPPSTPQNVLVAMGTIISHEHDSSGTARLVRLASGQVQLVFSDLATSDGPDLRVWLTDQPVIEGRDGWFVFDDGRYLELGPLKANGATRSTTCRPAPI